MTRADSVIVSVAQWKAELVAKRPKPVKLTTNLLLHYYVQHRWRASFVTHYVNVRPLGAVMAQIATLCHGASHIFWPDDVSIVDSMSFNSAHIHGPRQLTDVYLLGLTVQHLVVI